MSETSRYADLAQCFGRLAAQAVGQAERDDYHSAAAAYLQLAKDAARAELTAPAALPELD
jgi:hypothetical protein